MAESLTRIDERIKEAQQKAIEQQQQHEKLRQEQIDKIRDNAAREAATKLHEVLREKEQEALDKYLENLPWRLELYVSQQRAQRNGIHLRPEGVGLNPIHTPAQEAQLFDNSIKRLAYEQGRYVIDQTKELQQEWSTLTREALAKQSERSLQTTEREQVAEQGLDGVAARAARQGADPYAALKQGEDRKTQKQPKEKIDMDRFLSDPDYRREVAERQAEERGARRQLEEQIKRVGVELTRHR
jgi:hypothetical protein